MQIPAQIFHHRLEAPFHALEIRTAREAQLDECLRVGVDESLAWDLAAILDELASNVLRHSQATWMEWSLSRDADEGLLVLRFQDNGDRFDPASAPLPAAGHGFQGHMGLAMMRRLARNLRYRREGSVLNTLEVQLGPQARLALA
jgi:anti-sigma regulatory factor (Ser/Thr protein kinase)